MAGRIVIRNTKRSGLRELLIADREYRLPGCPQPGPWAARDDLLDRLRSGDAVVVSSAVLMKAHMHAGLPFRQYGYGGPDYGKSFLLDASGVLTEHQDEGGD